MIVISCLNFILFLTTSKRLDNVVKIIIFSILSDTILFFDNYFISNVGKNYEANNGKFYIKALT